MPQDSVSAMTDRLTARELAPVFWSSDVEAMRQPGVSGTVTVCCGPPVALSVTSVPSVVTHAATPSATAATATLSATLVNDPEKAAV